MENYTKSNLGFNISDCSSKLSDYGILDYITQVVCALILIVGGVGNTLVLIVFVRPFHKMKSFEIYVVSLATADLIGTVVEPSRLLHEALSRSIHCIGVIGCRVILFLTTTCITVSALTLLAISVDRYVIVTRPFRERTRNRSITSLIGISIIWLVGSANGVVYFAGDYVTLNKTNRGFQVCAFNFEPNDFRLFTGFTVALQNLTPLVLMVITYSLIIHTLHLQSRSLAECKLALKMRSKRNRKSVKLAVIMVTGFFICTAPYNFYALWYSFDPKGKGRSYYDAHSTAALLEMLLMVNCCANPIIYSQLHTKFRYGVLKLICPHFAKGYRWETVRSTFTRGLSRVRIYSRRAEHGNRESIKLTPVDESGRAPANNTQHSPIEGEEEKLSLVTADLRPRFDAHISNISHPGGGHHVDLPYNVSEDDVLFQLRRCYSGKTTTL